MKIKRLADGLTVAPLLWALQEHPEFWDQHTQRTEDPRSPHHDLSDIFVRYAADPNENGPHESVWYPCADILPVRQLVYPLMQFVHGEKLGGVLITRIPAGATCKPHTDPGWHAKEYEKFAIQIQSAPGQLFCFEGGGLETKPGDLFWFDNQYEHWVTNPTPYDRITMICCIKSDKGN